MVFVLWLDIRRLFFGWSYRPIRVLANQNKGISVELQSALPFFRCKMIWSRWIT